MKKVITLITSSSCAPCKLVTPSVVAFMEQNKDSIEFNIVKLEEDIEGFAAANGIRSVPALVIRGATTERYFLGSFNSREKLNDLILGN